VLHYIDISFSHPSPINFQTENHVIDGAKWRFSSQESFAGAMNAVDQINGPLWLNGHSSYHGLNDQVPVNLANQQTSSIILIQPQSVIVQVANESRFGGGTVRKVRCAFSYSGYDYVLSVTDPIALSRYGQAVGHYPLPNALLCVSFGEPYHGFAYKLVASIITP
jgi:hypothetical protein